jgi:hypothetical protein
MEIAMAFLGQYIYPPRTTLVTPFFFKKQISVVVKNWINSPETIAQFKLNGQRNIIHVSPDRQIKMWNRHNEPQKYDIPEDIRETILNISPENHYTVWDSELMHFKTKNIKNMIYFYDVLVWQSEKLSDHNNGEGMEYKDRYAILEEKLGDKKLTLDETSKNLQNIYMADNILPEKWADTWKSIADIAWIEGFVLKKMGFVSRLLPGTQEINNDLYQCRVRKPHKNYLF